MGDQSRNFEVVISWGSDLISVLGDRNGFDGLVQTLEHLRAIQFSCDQDFSEIQESLFRWVYCVRLNGEFRVSFCFCCADLKKKLDVCKEKTDEANSEIAEEEEEIERLQKELDDELEREWNLKEELRYVYYLILTRVSLKKHSYVDSLT
ncbi:unnamed protein product [Arabis nemorensis]|uniref:Uncharacterized protein n=1 Tax=Arabis nemorensis TaxID=586526 RepID=A0A565CGZ3_9BRAS|nr:unnamed protein product [Arabis nemorensis]